MCNAREHELRELWVKYKDSREWEYLDTETEHESAERLLQEYRLAFGPGFTFEIRLPDHYLNDAEEID